MASSPASGSATAPESPQAIRRDGWPTLRTGLGLGYVLAALLTAVAIWMASSAPLSGPVGPPSRTILIILGFNLVLIGILALSAGRRVFRLIVAQRRDAGARLRMRFVALFATAAVGPAIIIAIVFGLLVNQSVDAWFSHRVQTVVNKTGEIAQSTWNSQVNAVSDNISVMAKDLNGPAYIKRFKTDPVGFGNLLAGQAALRSFHAAYLIDRLGRVLARAEVESPPPFVMPSASAIQAADDGEVNMRPGPDDIIRAIYKLKNYGDVYLYVARPLEPGMMAYFRDSSASIHAYRDMVANRARIETDLFLSYVETVLLILVGAVWLGMTAATSISAPVARLIQAADRIAAGDLAARVPIEPGPEELNDLARSFNRMTADLQTQQAALRTAGADAESRRQFIEAVLSGVSAGVIGLGRDGRISAANSQALVLLGLPDERPHGQSLDEAAPEFSSIVAEAADYGGDAEGEVDVVRGGDTRRLRVRASAHADGGLVLTFDDITRLVTAQRNAAWKDVARRIAHEIKNPLTPIQLSAERLRRKYRKQIDSDLEIFDRCTDTIIRQVDGIRGMVDEFSAFARMPAPKFEEVDAAELLRQAVFAQRVADPDTEIALEEPLPSAPALCDARMIGQALTNVLKNAGEAIAARRLVQPDPAGRINARLVANGQDVAFEVEDNGVGLPAKDRDRLTEPYVTTREKGTGLGLAIVKRILEDHGGELVLADASSHLGAKVTLKLPSTAARDASASIGVAVA